MIQFDATTINHNSYFITTLLINKKKTIIIRENDIKNNLYHVEYFSLNIN